MLKYNTSRCTEWHRKNNRTIYAEINNHVKCPNYILETLN